MARASLPLVHGRYDRRNRRRPGSTHAMTVSWPMLSSAGHGCWANCESGSFSPLAMILWSLACRTARPAVAPAPAIDCRREPHKHLFTACPTEQPSRRPQHALRFRPQTAAAWRPLAELTSCAQVCSQQELWLLRGIAKTGPFPAEGSRKKTARRSQGEFATHLRPLATTAEQNGPGAINRHCPLSQRIGIPCHGLQ